MILVTGASGFLGKHLLHALSNDGIPVRALYNSTQPEQTLAGVEWMQCNLLDIFEVEAALKDITHVYHCAAIVSFNPKYKNQVIDDNTSATANIVNAALEAKVQKLIHVSSIAALGRNRVEQGVKIGIDEETFFEESKNNSAYSQGKFAAEMEVWRGIAEGLNAAIINPGIILGEGNWDVGSARLMKVVYDEFPWFTEGVNGWVDVQDVVKAMLLLMNSDVQEQRFVLTAGNFSYLEIFTKMANALNRKPPHQKASSFATAIVWRVEHLKYLLTGKVASVTKETARTAQLQCYYDNSKFLKAFTDFAYTPIEVTIKRMAQQFLKDLKNNKNS